MNTQKANGCARYTVKVGCFKGGKRFDVKDEYTNGHDYAFAKPEGTLYSYSPVAVQFVEKALEMHEAFAEIAQPGKCYQIVTDGPFGETLEIREVPVNWYNL